MFRGAARDYAGAMRTSSVVALVLVLAGCGGTDASGDASVPRDALPHDARAPDGAADGAIDGGEATALAIVRPASGDVVLETAVVDVRAGSVGADEIVIEIDGETEPRCRLVAAPYRCLVHLDARAIGSVDVSVRALRDGAEVERASLTLDKQSAFTDECPTDATACITELVGRGEAAGWEGVTYENMDGLHASLDTAGFPGIVRIDNSDALAGSNPGHRAADSVDGILLGNASVALTSPCCSSPSTSRMRSTYRASRAPRSTSPRSACASERTSCGGIPSTAITGTRTSTASRR